MTLGSRVRELRLGRDWTQEELAERAEMPQTTVSAIESGRVTRTSHENIVKLAGAFRVPVRALYEAAGMIEPADAPQSPAGVTANGEELPVERVIAYVENKPGRAFQERLARLRTQLSREDYERICIKIFGAWSSNEDLGLSLGEMLLRDQ